MSASALDRRHVRSVELAMELRAIAAERAELDGRDDVASRRELTFLRALRDWLRPIVESVPGGRRAWAFLVGLADARQARAVLERLDDRAAAREIQAATELAGLLDAAPTAVSA